MQTRPPSLGPGEALPVLAPRALRGQLLRTNLGLRACLLLHLRVCHCPCQRLILGAKLSPHSFPVTLLACGSGFAPHTLAQLRRASFGPWGSCSVRTAEQGAGGHDSRQPARFPPPGGRGLRRETVFTETQIYFLNIRVYGPKYSQVTLMLWLSPQVTVRSSCHICKRFLLTRK